MSAQTRHSASLRISIAAAIVALSACASDPEPIAWDKLPSDTSEGAPEQPAQAAETSAVSSLSLAQALARADEQHPGLASYRSLAAAAEGHALQAGLLPNPELVLRVENAPFSSGSTRDEANYVAGVTIPLALSGRLGAAEDVERRRAEQRLAELASARADLHRKIRGAFATALSLEQAWSILRDSRELFRQSVSMLESRVRAGDAIPADLAQAEVAGLSASLEMDRVEGQRKQALRGLAEALGDPSLTITSLEGDLEAALEVPTLESLTARLATNPRLQAAEAAVALQAARLELAEARRIPDVSLDLFYRRLEQTNQHAFDVGLSVPLPFFNRSQGSVQAALAEQTAAEARVRATRNELVTELHGAHMRLERALARALMLRDEILPRAEVVLASVEARFKAGDASLAETLPTRREWARLRLDRVEALRDVMVAWSKLTALVDAD